MLLHVDGSRHRWFQDERWYDLIVILDDASSQIYYAQLVEEESTLTVMAALREVIERKACSAPCTATGAAISCMTPKAGGKGSIHNRLTQVGRALRELGIQMIPAYSPQARGRTERNFGTWQGRLPQELRLHGIRTLEAGQQLSAASTISPPSTALPGGGGAAGHAFVPCPAQDLDRVFALQYERTVNRDNTVSFENLVCRSSRCSGAPPWPAVRSRCTSIRTERLSLRYGPHWLGRYTASGMPLTRSKTAAPKTVEKTRPGKVLKPAFPPAWKSRTTARIPTFPQLRRLRLYEQNLKNQNRTFHVLQKADIFTC